MDNKYYSWKPDLPDNRDYIFKGKTKMAGYVDLRPYCPPVLNQGNLGSCTANAIASAIQIAENLDNDRVAGFLPSRLFIYYQERVLEGTVNYDAGAMIRDGVKVCNKIGACHETIWPYLISKFKNSPSPAAYRDATKYKISSYYRVTNLNSFKSALTQGYPVIFGFTVYQSFESNLVSKSGIVPMPKPKEKVLGGHAVLAVGYSDRTQRIIVRNSWGTNWGINGYFTMPYAYITNRNLSDDFWVIMR